MLTIVLWNVNCTSGVVTIFPPQTHELINFTLEYVPGSKEPAEQLKYEGKKTELVRLFLGEKGHIFFPTFFSAIIKNRKIQIVFFLLNFVQLSANICFECFWAKRGRI